MSALEEMKKELIGIITRSLNIGLKYGVITKEEFIESMHEANDIQNDSPEKIRALFNLLIEDREQREFENRDSA